MKVILDQPEQELEIIAQTLEESQMTEAASQIRTQKTSQEYHQVFFSRIDTAAKILGQKEDETFILHGDGFRIERHECLGIELHVYAGSTHGDLIYLNGTECAGRDLKARRHEYYLDRTTPEHRQGIEQLYERAIQAKEDMQTQNGNDTSLVKRCL